MMFFVELVRSVAPPGSLLDGRPRVGGASDPPYDRATFARNDTMASKTQREAKYGPAR
jgi:hypothetical protein